MTLIVAGTAIVPGTTILLALNVGENGSSSLNVNTASDQNPLWQVLRPSFRISTLTIFQGKDINEDALELVLSTFFTVTLCAELYAEKGWKGKIGYWCCQPAVMLNCQYAENSKSRYHRMIWRYMSQTHGAHTSHFQAHYTKPKKKKTRSVLVL